jgi:hypothetical protein
VAGGAFRTLVADVRSLGIFGRAWVVGNIAFSAGRALIAWPTFGRYGLNPWTFLFLDVITAPPYGLSQALTVKILRDPDRPAHDSFVWCAGVAVFFLLPYVYLFTATGDVPAFAYIGVLLWMAVFGVLTVIRIVKEVRADDETVGAEDEPV